MGRKKRKLFKSRKKGLFYIVEQQPDGPCKIGVSKNFPSRLSSLQCANPNELKLHTVVKLARISAYKFETKMKECLKEWRIRGEWYNLSPERILEISSNVKDTFDRGTYDSGLIKNIGLPCKKGHTTGRYISTGQCVQCAKDYSIKWRTENKDRYREYHLAYDSRKRKQRKDVTPLWADKRILKDLENRVKNSEENMSLCLRVPLKHRNICGLYVENNITIVPKNLEGELKNMFNPKQEEDWLMSFLRNRGLAN